MSIRINSNISALAVQRKLQTVGYSLESSFARLSSGSRINTASDDAAGLAVVSNLRADSRVFAVGIRNLNDGISVLNIASESSSQLSTITTRIKELSEQSANGVYGLSQRKAMQSEADELVKEFNRIIYSTSFNGVKIFDGSLLNLSLQAGSGTGSVLSVGVGSGLTHSVGTGSFNQTQSFSMGSSMGRSVTGDFNGDGKADVISALLGAGKISVQLGNGDGTFVAPQSYSASAPNNSLEVASNDFNNDGKNDIAIAGNDGVYILFGNGDGTFQAPSTYDPSAGVSSDVRGLTSGDMNNDGIIDLVMTDFAGSSMMVMIGNSNGSFRVGTSYASANATNQVQLGDLNGDGLLDAVVANFGNTEVFINSGSGFSRTILSGSGAARSITLGDFNRDGMLDIASGDTNAGTIGLLLGNGNGSFRAKVNLSIGSAAANKQQIAAADYNGDGFLDLGVASFDTNSFSILVGNGDGSFAIGITSATGNGPRTISTADFNADGALDIYSTMQNEGYGRLHLAQTVSSQSIQYFNILNQADARSSLDRLDSIMGRINAELGWVGSHQSRIEAASKTLSIARENYESAASRIWDVDVADESAKLLANQIRQQVASSVLKQAALEPQLALKLLT